MPPVPRLTQTCTSSSARTYSIHDVYSAVELVEKEGGIVALDRGSDQDKRPLAQVSTVLGPSTTYREKAATAPLRLGGSPGSPCHT